MLKARLVRLILTFGFVGLCFASAGQISYVTVPTLKSPLPFGAPAPFNPVPATNAVQAAPASAPRVVLQMPPARPSLSKEELEQNVIAFQQKQATGGSASAQYELGVRYLTGQGVGQNLRTARKWLTQAAENGDSLAPQKLRELDRIEKRRQAVLEVQK